MNRWGRRGGADAPLVDGRGRLPLQRPRSAPAAPVRGRRAADRQHEPLRPDPAGLSGRACDDFPHRRGGINGGLGVDIPFGRRFLARIQYVTSAIREKRRESTQRYSESFESHTAKDRISTGMPTQTNRPNTRPASP